MNERERLIELIINADTYDSYECKLCTKDDDACDCCHAEKLADHLLANGVIVPPCKVGDTVWVKWGKEYGLKETIHPVKVYALRFDTKKNNMRICVEGRFEAEAYGGHFTHYYNGAFVWKSVGKTVFLSREEAEKALKERSYE